MNWLLVPMLCVPMSALAQSGQNASADAERVGPHGGRVNLVHFAVTGDTRPPNCRPDPAGNYPAPILRTIADDIRARGAQFVLDLGDHMNVCADDERAAEAAESQMEIYMGAVARYGGSWFMTMGNHECTKPFCATGDPDAAFYAFMRALSPYSVLPYYSVDVETSQGLLELVVIADNAWDERQARWLEQTLAAADRKAKYTVVARHHPPDNNYPASNLDIARMIRAHKFALFLTGHLHLYKLLDTDNGRDMVLGTSGAPADGGSFYGYAMVDQLSGGELQVSVYDTAGDMLRDRWSVGPNESHEKQQLAGRPSASVSAPGRARP